LSEGLDRYDVQLHAYQLMPNHWHLILRPGKDGEMSRLLRWVTATHTMRYHAHYHSSGQGHVYQGRFKSFPVQGDGHFRVACRYVERNALRAGLVDQAEEWRWGSLWRWVQRTEPDWKLLSPWPVRRPRNWIAHVNKPLSEKELQAVRHCANRGRPLGDAGWVESAARPGGWGLNQHSARVGAPEFIHVPPRQTKSPDPFFQPIAIPLRKSLFTPGGSVYCMNDDRQDIR